MPVTAPRGPSATPARRTLAATLTSLVLALTGGGVVVGAVATAVATESPEVAPEAVVAAAATEQVGTPLPHHILDIGPVPPGRVSCFNVADERGVPAGVTGVVINVTAVQPDNPGFAVVYPQAPNGGPNPPPATSTVNFEPGQDVASTTFVPLPPSGNLCHSTEGGRLQRLVVDLVRYVSADSGIRLSAPQRLLDTRPLGSGDIRAAVPPRTTQTVQVAGRAGVPANAEAVVLNVTVAGVTDVGNLRAFPGGAQPPNTSVLNYVPGVDKANSTVVRLSDTGSISLWSDTAQPVHVILDVLGHVEPGSEYTDVEPTRVLDTRADSRIGALNGPLRSHTVHTANLRGAGVPAGATAVVVNMTAIGPTQAGNLRAWADTVGDGTTQRPEVSMVNYVRGRAVPNLVVVDLPASGRVNFWSDMENGLVDIAVDVLGYIT